MLNSLFGRKQTSGDVAKKRLRFVLVQDRLSLTPEQLHSLKSEMLDVISRYVEIDRENIDIALSGNGRENMLTANIPVFRNKVR